MPLKYHGDGEGMILIRRYYVDNCYVDMTVNVRHVSIKCFLYTINYGYDDGYEYYDYDGNITI